MTAPTSDEAHDLVNQAVTFAVEMLREFEVFMPVAHVVRSDGSLGLVAAAGDSDEPSTEELVKVLLLGLRQAFDRGDIRRSAVCLDGLIRDPGDGTSTDAIIVCIEAPDAAPIKVAVPYRRDAASEVTIEAAIRLEGEPMVFAQGQ